MANMSYCRFHNTNLDLDDCLEALANRNISSKSEKRAAKKMLEKVLHFLGKEGIVVECDYDNLDQVIAECGEREDEE